VILAAVSGPIDLPLLHPSRRRHNMKSGRAGGAIYKLAPVVYLGMDSLGSFLCICAPRNPCAPDTVP
jgi:hypothetical protein